MCAEHGMGQVLGLTPLHQDVQIYEPTCATQFNPHSMQGAAKELREGVMRYVCLFRSGYGLLRLLPSGESRRTVGAAPLRNVTAFART